MKKVLIISGNNHKIISGVDMYTSRVIDILQKEGCIVDEYSFEINMTKSNDWKEDNVKIISPNKKFNDCKKLKIKWWIKNIYNLFYRSPKQLNKLIDEYDLVIDSSLMLVRSKKVLKSDKYLYIQHQNVDFFEMKRYKLFRQFAVFLIWVTGFKNGFKFANNIVFYDENNKNYIQKKFPNKGKTKYFTILNSSVSRDVIEQNKKIKDEIYRQNSFTQKIIYIGRITVEQKRMNDVNRMLKRTRNKLDVYGYGTYDKKLAKNKNVIYHGKVSRSEALNINLHSKFSMLLSNYEGLSSSMVESICSLTPIIIRNSHLSAKFLVDNNKNGFLWSNSGKAKEYSVLFDEISELPIEKIKELSDNCYQFAINNLLYETFEKKWLKVYHEMVDK